MACACACGPSVNRTLTIELNVEKVILYFKLISSDKNYLEFNISLTLCLKIRNRLQEIPLIKGFSAVPRALPSFTKIFSFDLVELSLPKLFSNIL